MRSALRWLLERVTRPSLSNIAGGCNALIAEGHVDDGAKSTVDAASGIATMGCLSS